MAAVKDSRAKTSVRVGWSAELRHGLGADGVPRAEMPRQPTESLHVVRISGKSILAVNF